MRSQAFLWILQVKINRISDLSLLFYGLAILSRFVRPKQTRIKVTICVFLDERRLGLD